MLVGCRSRYFACVQDPHGFYGPVDPNFGKLMTTPEHQRLNNAYVHQMLTAGLLRKGGNGRDFRWPFASSLYRVFRFHLGSVCVGAFLIALVQFIRAVFSYIERSTRSWQNKNKCFACMFRVVRCVSFVQQEHPIAAVQMFSEPRRWGLTIQYANVCY